MCNNNSWSELYNFRNFFSRRFGSIYHLPIVYRARDILLSSASNGQDILEIGAGDRRMRTRLEQANKKIRYHSMDIDPRGEHDFHSLEEITERYDLLVAFEVIEHLAFDEIPLWLRKLRGFTHPGGKLLLSTPNTYYPSAYLRDATHKTPLCYDELAGLAAAAGWEVQALYRVQHDPFFLRIARRYLFGWLFRLLGLDFARQIVLVAVNPK